MNRISRVVVVLVAAALVAPAQAQQKPPGEELVVKVYRVIDLVLPVPNYPYQGSYLPQADLPSAGRTGTSMPGLKGSSGMGGMGGGMFRVPDHLGQVGGSGGGGSTPPASSSPPAGTMQLDMDTLIEAITEIVEPHSWDEVGGPGSIQPFRGSLAVRQTPAIQAKVQEFLDALKRESGALHAVTVKARWLMLDDEQRGRLAEKSADQQTSATVPTLDRKALAALPPQTVRYAGQITCFNGQTVHLVSGRMETVVGGAIPIVGPPAAYQPVMLWPHLGALLQITPSALPGDEGMVVDLYSCVTRWEPSDKAAHIGTIPEGDSSINLDRINVTAQQFATSLRVPLDQPVLIGGVTFPGSRGGSTSGQQAENPDSEQRAGLYLVLEIAARAD